MTLDSERKRSVEQVWDFLARLADHRRSKRVPNEVRLEAAGLLRHYPHPAELTGWDGRQMLRCGAPGDEEESTTSPEI